MKTHALAVAALAAGTILAAEHPLDSIRPSFSLEKTDKAFMAQPAIEFSPAGGAGAKERAIVVDLSQRDQPLLGLGSIFTGTDLHALMRLTPEKCEAALKALFDPKEGAGWSLMRIPFGSTDWEPSPEYFTYDDAPDGVRDWELEYFSIKKDIDRGLFAILRRAKTINPELRFHAAVWGIPAWMKDNRSRCYGRFDPACTEVYARYLARTVLAYREQGIELVAVSPQNESLTANDRPTPATCMPWWIQRDVVLAMRRAFDEAGLENVAVWAFDHNFDLSDFFVRPLLADGAARSAIGGIAYHDYGGEPEPAMGRIHAENPDLPLYSTERTHFGVAGMARIVRQLRAGARCYNHWSTLSNEFRGPNQFVGQAKAYWNPLPADLRDFLCVPLDDPSDFQISPSWGLFGELTRNLRPGMVRVGCTGGFDEWIRTVAFVDDASGEAVLVTTNDTDEEQRFVLVCGGAEAGLSQPAHSVASWKFTPGPLCKASSRAVVEIAPPKPAPVWDVAVTDVSIGAEPVAGTDIPVSCTVRNAGDAPIPKDAKIRVDFYLDGNIPIALAIRTLPPLAPGESAEISANIPVGMPYHYRVSWRAEEGHHQIFAYAAAGNARPERNLHNNWFAREFDFAAPASPAPL